ncbi:hypothetical protein [Paenarthrobacter ureafaciens]|nr:hypothetical protein [Paenarthrobacter ureafaciens]MEC3853942.1 hypothetical protein [Paenarthrobacter ureafaciens]
MKVILTVEANNGDLSHVETEGGTYEEAKAVAENLIPDHGEAIAGRVER